MGTFRAFAARRRGSLRLGGGLLGLGVLAAVVLIGSANAGTSTKFYVASFSPALAQPGAQHAYTLTITNCGTGTAGCNGLVSSQTLGSANVSIPSNYSVVMPSTPLWTQASGVLQFRAGKAPSLAPGASTSVTLNVTPNASANARPYCYSYAWPAQVKQSNNFSGTGNDFLPAVSGNNPTLTVASLVFGPQPADTEVNKTIGGANGVGVSVQDGCGNPVATSGSVGISIGSNPNVSGGTLSGTTPVALASGTATFSNLSIDTPGSGYTLVASPAANDLVIGNLGSTTSDSFTIASPCTTANTNACHTSNGGTSLDVTVPPAGSTTDISLGSPSVQAQCSTKTSLGAIASIVPNYNTGTITVTLVYDASIATTPGISSYVGCISKDNGTSWMLLSNCTGNNGPPCVSSKQHPGGGALTIVLSLPAGDPLSGGFG